MSNLLYGRAELALRLEKAFGLSEDTPMQTQTARDLVQVRAREGAIEVKRGRVVSEAASLAGLQPAKVALGERESGRWEDGAPDYNRRRVERTSDAHWWAGCG